MSLKVYFDNTLIDEQYYTGLNNNNELFNDNFKLGSTPCNQFTLKVAKEGVTQQPTTIKLYDETTQFADLKIDNIEEQDYEYVYTLTDRMIDLNFNYDASEIFENGHTTLYNIALDICTKAGLILGTNDFRGYDKQITWYDNTRTAREYIGFIAELNGGFARIENNTLYFIKQKTNSVKTIDIEDCEDFKIGERHLITRVVYELGAVKYEFGNETGNTLYLNSDNVYITSESEVEGIYNDINGFEFYSYTTNNCPIDYDIKAGDVITFTDGENEYPTIAQYDLEYFGGWYGGYDLEVNTERQEETQIIGDKQNIKNLRIIVDRDANTITQVVEEVGEQNQKIAQVTQTVNELNSKISDIADITTSQETLNGTLEFTDINQSEPIEIKIHPTTTNISYLYPRADLYPSDILYMPDRTILFTNTTTEETFPYTLPDDLLISQNGVYDEFYLGYDQQVCQVIKRCGYNADGTVYELDEEVIHTYTPYPSIPLTDGDYEIELLGYDNAYMSMRLMAQNIYTTQFATKTEVTSEINQKANEITTTVAGTYATKGELNTAKTEIKQTTDSITSTVSQVNSKADTNASNISTLQQTADGLTSTVATKVGNNEVISKINQSSEAVSINANKISLNGKTINMTSDNIAINSTNFKVDKNGNVTANSLESSNATITGGSISLVPTGGLDVLRVIKNNNTSTMSYMTEDTVGINLNNDHVECYCYSGGPRVDVYREGTSGTYITHTGIRTPSVTQTSKEEDKKDFEKYNNALEIIKNIDIYKYHLKDENEEDKKHIGFVIGKDFKYSKEVTSKNNDGVDIYSFVSLCCQAIKEQQQKIEELEKRLEGK